MFEIFWHILAMKFAKITLKQNLGFKELKSTARKQCSLEALGQVSKQASKQAATSHYSY